MKRLKSGVLVVFEGIDGSGKTTLVRSLATLFADTGFSVLTTREPGATEQGKAIRALVQQSAGSLLPTTEFLLFSADRAEHIEKEILPALCRNMLVLCDRMADSSLAYQGYGRGVDRTMIQRITDWVMQDVSPHITVYLALTYATAQERLRIRGGTLSAFDREKEIFFQRVIDGYDSMYAKRSDVIRVDGSLDPDAMSKTVYQELLTKLQFYEQ